MINTEQEKIKRCNTCKAVIWRFWYWRTKLPNSVTPVLICASCHEKSQYIDDKGTVFNTYDSEIVMIDKLYQMNNNDYFNRDPARGSEKSPAWEW